jgi:hypothetical protein
MYQTIHQQCTHAGNTEIRMPVGGFCMFVLASRTLSNQKQQKKAYP